MAPDTLPLRTGWCLDYVDYKPAFGWNPRRGRVAGASVFFAAMYDLPQQDRARPFARRTCLRVRLALRRYLLLPVRSAAVAHLPAEPGIRGRQMPLAPIVAQAWRSRFQ
jgi:hypothetical protein